MKNLILLFGFLLLCTTINAQNLFINEDGKKLKTEENKMIADFFSTKYVKNYHVGHVDLSVLKKDVFYLQIPGESNVLYEKSSKNTDEETWVGNSKTGDLIMVWEDGKYLGTITYENRTFQICSFGDYGLIFELDHSKYPLEACHLMDDNGYNNQEYDTNPADPNVQDSGSYECNLRVLVAYTPSAASASPNTGYEIRLLTKLAIAETNQSYSNSRINYKVELAACIPVNYTESSFETDLARFRTPSDGYMDEIHTFRNLYSADVCVLIINNSAYCGLASTIMANASTAFCAVHYTCATGYYSFAHEIGHLQGARHDVAVDNTNTPYSYGHGYVSPGSNWRTIMAYGNACNNCQRLKYWSNPNVLYPIDGRAMGNSSTADNARVLNTTMSTLMAFNQPPQSLAFNQSVSKYADVIAKNEITTQGTVNVASNAELYMRAGSKIILTSGFKTNSNSIFNAKITNVYDCGAGRSLISSPLEVSNIADSINSSEIQTFIVDENRKAKLIDDDNLFISAYPNPASDMLNIDYYIPNEDYIIINLLDAYGRKLANHNESQTKEKGRYSISFNLKGLPSGVYFIVLTMKDSQKTKINKIIVQ